MNMITYRPSRRGSRLLKDVAFLGFIYLASYAFSYFMLQYYVLGDQAHYIQFWKDASAASFSGIIKIQLSDVGGIEPLFGAIIWVASRIFRHDIFISLINGIFIVALTKNLRRMKTPIPILFLILTNFYVLVLLVPAERLKFAFLLVLLALLTTGWRRVLLLVTAPFGHFQMLITYGQVIAALQAGKLKRLIQSGKIGKLSLIMGAVFAIFGVFIFIKFNTTIMEKIAVYNQKANFFDLIKIVVLYAITMVSCRDRWTISGAFIFTIVVGLIVGPQRVNMLGYLAFCYFFLVQRKFYNPLFILTLLYFSARSIDFINQVLAYGVVHFS